MTNPIQVVGVVRDAKYARLIEEKQVFVFSPYSQRYRNGSMTFYVRTVQDPESIGTALRKAGAGCRSRSSTVRDEDYEPAD